MRGGCQAVELTWENVRCLCGGSSRVRSGADDENEDRGLSADTIRLLPLIRHGADDAEIILGIRPNQKALRKGAAAKQADRGPGCSDDSPRLGIMPDMETLSLHLLGGYAAGQCGVRADSAERRRASRTWDSSR